ncbi:rhodanese-like domain-containing protein [Enterococcus ureasiticus]|uniref:Rhodanese n=1 Tax=Enterococcus ureasiticus TaxID=903984 RepID=A0A1E5GGG1_9ENTE|nr:rhodanese-like domain-containing protein [Enterococcus ureasiticus]OEG11685.1 rhodanese [Enterococcus ureasiticus]
MKRVSIKELKKLIELTVNEPVSIIDVRDVDEFAAGHIVNAKNYPLSTLPETMTEINREQPHYVICQHGVRSEHACSFLENYGYNVVSVSEGMSVWDGKEKSYR